MNQPHWQRMMGGANAALMAANRARARQVNAKNKLSYKLIWLKLPLFALLDLSIAGQLKPSLAGLPVHRWSATPGKAICKCSGPPI